MAQCISKNCQMLCHCNIVLHNTHYVLMISVIRLGSRLRLLLSNLSGKHGLQWYNISQVLLIHDVTPCTVIAVQACSVELSWLFNSMCQHHILTHITICTNTLRQLNEVKWNLLHLKFIVNLVTILPTILYISCIMYRCSYFLHIYFSPN